MTRQMAALSLWVAFLTLSSTVLATDRLVPSEYPTIQAAIDDCNNGDIVIVEPNTYTGPGNRDLDFGGKAITVQSINPTDPCIVAATIIDCNGSVADPHRGFYFHSGEDVNSVVSGLTITNGYAEAGGAIYLENSGATILRCRVIGNAAKNGETVFDGWEYGTDGGKGGGICCISSSLVVYDSNIAGNNAGNGGDGLDGAGDGGSGGGIYSDASSSLVVRDSIITSNVAGDGGDGFMGGGGIGGDGGGICCCSTIIENCTISGNRTGKGGADYGMGYRSGDGGGICCTGSLTLINSVITENEAGDGSGPLHGNGYGGNGGDGGGVYCLGCPLVEIEDCNISGNSAGHGGAAGFTTWGGGRGGNGGGVYCESCSTVTIETSIFKDNSAGNADGGVEEGGQGGGIWCSSASVSNCVIIGNTSGDGSLDLYGDDIGTNAGDGGGIYCGSVTISNCLIVDNSTGDGGAALWEGGDGGDGAGIFCSTGSSAVVTSCTIAGNITGAGGDSGFTPGANGIGGGLYADSNTVISDSIIWGNSPEQLFGQDCNNVSFCDIGNDTCTGGTGNISADPLFVSPGYWADANDPNIVVEPNDPNAVWVDGDYHLSQIAAGQVLDSPCVDAGSDTAVNLGMDKFTTRTDKVWDKGIVDMGYHYSENIADLNDDGMVDMVDFAILTSQWQQELSSPSADIAPAGGDGIVNERDLRLLVDNWLWVKD